MRFLKKVNHLQINILTYIQERVLNWQSLNTVNFYVYKDLDYSFYTQKRDVFIAKTVSLGRSCSLLEIYKKIYQVFKSKCLFFFKFTYRSNVSKIRHSFSIVTFVKKKKKEIHKIHGKKSFKYLEISLRQSVYYYYCSKKECLFNSKNYS